MLLFEVSQQTKISISYKWIQQIAESFNAVQKLKGDWYFSLAFVDQKTIKQLNKTYRGKNTVTDVLSFENNQKDFVAMPADKNYLGEIVICVSQARVQAQDLKCNLSQEVARLLVHGLAHLSGYDHENCSAHKALQMLQFEKKILLKLGIWDIFKFEADPQNY